MTVHAVTFSDSDETGHNYAGRLVDDGTISVIENQSLRLGQVNLWNPSSRSVLTLVFVWSLCVSVWLPASFCFLSVSVSKSVRFSLSPSVFCLSQYLSLSVFLCLFLCQSLLSAPWFFACACFHLLACCCFPWVRVLYICFGKEWIFANIADSVSNIHRLVLTQANSRALCYATVMDSFSLQTPAPSFWSRSSRECMQ